MNLISSIISILIILIPFSSAKEKENEVPVTSLPKPVSIKTFEIIENDTLNYQINLAFDSLNQPLYYYRNIFTPVCYTNKCHPVFINFYWDLLGNFIEYDFPPNKILTKVDHDPFQEEDYQKLLEIISNKNSLLKAYKMEELVATKTMNNGVDVVTGATLKTIKNEVIEGAVYTCYTLWHIANGKVKQELAKITENRVNTDLLTAFLESNNHHYHYYAVDKVFEQTDLFPEFASLIFEQFNGENIFLSKYILEHFPDTLLSESEVQENLLEVYQQTNYSLQVEMLQKFASVQFAPKALSQLTKKQAFENFNLFKLKTEVLLAQQHLPKEAQAYLTDHLQNQDTRVGQLAYETLLEIRPKDKSIRKKMAQYKANKK